MAVMPNQHKATPEVARGMVKMDTGIRMSCGVPFLSGLCPCNSFIRCSSDSVENNWVKR